MLRLSFRGDLLVISSPAANPLWMEARLGGRMKLLTLLSASYLFSPHQHFRFFTFPEGTYNISGSCCNMCVSGFPMIAKN